MILGLKVLLHPLPRNENEQSNSVDFSERKIVPKGIHLT